MNAQFLGHCRGRFAAVEPELHRVLLEGLVKLLPCFFRFGHRCIHTGIVFGCLSLPVSVKSRQPQGDRIGGGVAVLVAWGASILTTDGHGFHGWGKGLDTNYAKGR